jgi:uncharacterized protein (TIGR02147 family)
MVDIFNYTDFLKYFEDYYAWKKTSDPSFAYSTIAQMAGFNNKGFAYSLFHGRRPISPANCRKISLALRHSAKEAKYFQLLVNFNQTVDLKKKNYYYKEMSGLSRHGKGFTPAQILDRDQYEYYSKWYHSAIRSIIGMYLFKDDYFWLARMVSPPISTGKAKKSVELLKKLGLVIEGRDKYLEISDRNITSGREISGIGLRNFHFDCTDLAKRAITTLGRDKRHIMGLTVGVSEEVYKEICEKIEEFQKELIKTANKSRYANRVYQINFHTFPLARVDKKRKVRP